MEPIFVEWAFKALITGSIIYGVRVLSQLQSSVESLNIKIAVIIEKVSGHEKELNKHEIRLIKLEEGE